MWFILQPHFTKACYRMLKLQLRAAYQACNRVEQVYSAKAEHMQLLSHKQPYQVSPPWTNHEAPRQSISQEQDMGCASSVFHA